MVTGSTSSKNPQPQIRKKPIAWDTDAGRDGKTSSMEMMLNWLLRDEKFRIWRTGVSSNGQQMSKKSLISELLNELLQAGIDYRKQADIHTKIYQLEHDFEKARLWIVNNNKDLDSATHDDATRAIVMQKCKYYYRIEPTFSEFLPFKHKTPSSAQHTPDKKEEVQQQQAKQSTPPHHPISQQQNLAHMSAFAPIRPVLSNDVHPSHPPAPTSAESSSSLSSSQPVAFHPSPSRYPPHLQEEPITSNERIEIQRLRLRETIHLDRMEIKRRKLAIRETESLAEMEIARRQATAQILAAHAQLIAELRTLGLPNAEIIDYLKKSENI
ncbi:hypothetical protein BX666DRAFT_1931650 [Dichotomocladium elegans]|nr:hypothetical protein BX666DRAFT_1931650 [Dichotomocladium elegans]